MKINPTFNHYYMYNTNYNYICIIKNALYNTKICMMIKMKLIFSN